MLDRVEVHQGVVGVEDKSRRRCQVETTLGIRDQGADRLSQNGIVQGAIITKTKIEVADEDSCHAAVGKILTGVARIMKTMITHRRHRPIVTVVVVPRMHPLTIVEAPLSYRTTHRARSGVTSTTRDTVCIIQTYDL